MIREFIRKRYPDETERTRAIRSFVIEMWDKVTGAGIGDANLERELCSGLEPQYFQRMSELLFTNELLNAGLAVSSPRHAPDLLVTAANRRIWIEIICPEPVGIPEEYLRPMRADERLRAVDFPHEAILLRWTAAIKEKAEKLLGTQDRVGYLERRVVREDDAYVIAVNSRRLGALAGDAHIGISQLPAAIEAVFCVGPYALRLDRETLQVVGRGHQHRAVIPKPRGAGVSANTFFDRRFAAISAVWAGAFDETWVVGGPKRLTVVHNLYALSPVGLGLLPAFEEYVAREVDEQHVRLENLAGRLVTAS